MANPHTSGVILIITFAAQPKAARSTASHNFISINPVTASSPDPDTWLNDYAQSVVPMPVHSHNDYWRPHPLYSALAAGCMGVEADLWLSPDGQDLLVGHHEAELSKDRSLQSLYLNPLQQILDRLNPSNSSGSGDSGDQDSSPHGVFRTASGTTLMLLVDVKGDPEKIWPLVDKQLQPLRARGYLSRIEYANATSASSPGRPVLKEGPITVVGTGNMSNMSKSNASGVGCDALTRYPDSFLDAPLTEIANPQNYGTLADCNADSLLGLPLVKFYSASTSFSKNIGMTNFGLSDSQRAKVRSMLQAAEAKNLVSRYWSLPAWPISRRDQVWSILAEEGIGLLNADDIESATRLEWNRAYKAELIWIGVSSAYILVVSLGFAYWINHRLRKLSRAPTSSS